MLRWLRLFSKALMALTFALLCAFMPIAAWAPPWFVQFQCAIMASLLVIYTGKLLFDTLFYDHYWP